MAEKLLSEARIEAPFHAPYVLSGVVKTLTEEPGRAKEVVSSDLSRSLMPSYMVEPPDRVTF